MRPRGPDCHVCVLRIEHIPWGASLALLHMFTGRSFLIPAPKEADSPYACATSGEREAVDA